VNSFNHQRILNLSGNTVTHTRATCGRCLECYNRKLQLQFLQMTNAIVTQFLQLTFVQMYYPLQRSGCLQVFNVTDIIYVGNEITWELCRF